jgi:hypothetical protein
MMSLGKAAEIFEHYIKIALERSGTPITGDMQDELSDAVHAFRSAENTLISLDSGHGG